MTKKIKRSLMLLFSVLLLMCAILLIAPSYASADSVNEVTEEDTIDSRGYYKFTRGASLNVDCFSNDGFYTLGFNFQTLTPKAGNLRSLSPLMQSWWGLDVENYFDYNFTVYRDDQNGTTGTALAEYHVSFYLRNSADNPKFFKVVYVRPLSYYDEVITIDGMEWYDVPDKGLFAGDYAMVDYIRQSGCTVLSYGLVNESGMLFDNSDELVNFTYVAISVNSAHISYYVKFDYHFHYAYEKHFVDGAKYADAYGTARTDSRSVYQVLYNMNEAGDLETIFPYEDELAKANDILAGKQETVTVKYLEPIEGTPFATHVYKSITVPSADGKIRYDDVCLALDKDSLKCYDSNFLEFVKVNDVYVAVYMKSIWLRSITADGQYHDYFLDLNESYEDRYQRYVTSGVIDSGLYEWFFNTKLLNKFPELDGYSYDELYGYFGFVVVPQAYTFDKLFVDMFDVETSKVGLCEPFVYEKDISYESYQSLMDLYDYSWLGKAWSGISGFVSGGQWPASHYFFYSEPGTELVIGEGGQDDANDTDGVLVNKAQDIGGAIGGVISSIWNGITSPFGLGSIGGVFILILGVWVYSKVKPNTVKVKKEKQKNKKKKK